MALRRAEVEQHRLSLVKETEDAPRAACGDDIEIGHATSQQRMSLPQIVPNVQAGHHPGDVFARLLHLEQVAHNVAHGQRAIVLAVQRDLRHRGLEHARTHRVTLGVIRVEQAVR